MCIMNIMYGRIAVSILDSHNKLDVCSSLVFIHERHTNMVDLVKASVTIMADFSPEFDPPVRWRSKHQTKK